VLWNWRRQVRNGELAQTENAPGGVRDDGAGRLGVSAAKVAPADSDCRRNDRDYLAARRNGNFFSGLLV
jgi:hypothetical protein